MRIFLDAHDLIDLLGGRGPCSPDELRHCLLEGNHRVVLSPTVVFEIEAPIADPSARTVVTRLLNVLEKLPLAYIADGQISRRELISAIESFTTDRDYEMIDPYVARFDAAIPTSGPPATANYLNFGLAETVWTIWQQDPEVFRWSPQLVDRFRSAIAADRNLGDPPSLSAHYREKVKRNLRSAGIPQPSCSVDELADWIYESPNRCPGDRIAYEVSHHLRRNVGDEPSASDFGDLAHIHCLPYVDLITLDRRMANYVRIATREWPPESWRKVRLDLASVLRDL